MKSTHNRQSSWALGCSSFQLAKHHFCPPQAHSLILKINHLRIIIRGWWQNLVRKQMEIICYYQPTGQTDRRRAVLLPALVHPFASFVGFHSIHHHPTDIMYQSVHSYYLSPNHYGGSQGQVVGMHCSLLYSQCWEECWGLTGWSVRFVSEWMNEGNCLVNHHFSLIFYLQNTHILFLQTQFTYSLQLFKHSESKMKP